jgi:hypothetical protein
VARSNWVLLQGGTEGSLFEATSRHRLELVIE